MRKKKKEFTTGKKYLFSKIKTMTTQNGQKHTNVK